jgi:hypothetical protein
MPGARSRHECLVLSGAAAAGGASGGTFGAPGVVAITWPDFLIDAPEAGTTTLPVSPRTGGRIAKVIWTRNPPAWTFDGDAATRDGRRLIQGDLRSKPPGSRCRPSPTRYAASRPTPPTSPAPSGRSPHPCWPSVTPTAVRSSPTPRPRPATSSAWSTWLPSSPTKASPSGTSKATPRTAC